MPNREQNHILMFALAVFPAFAELASQPLEPRNDSPQTLQWVSRQAERAGTVLQNAMRDNDASEVIIRLTECYQIFDAVALAGLYCYRVRAAAEEGRYQCDVINFKLNKDFNTQLARAAEARKAAARMKEAALFCLYEMKPGSTSEAASFTPNDILRYDAQLAELDLQDGMASQDLHILSQKIEHARRLLYDIEHLARSMDNCAEAYIRAEKAIEHCQKAISSLNWFDVSQAVAAALEEVRAIQSASCN